MTQSAVIEIAGIFVLSIFILFNLKGLSAVPGPIDIVVQENGAFYRIEIAQLDDPKVSPPMVSGNISII